MNQHRTVGLLEHIAAHFDLVVRSDCHEMRFEGGMMKCAQGDAVRYGGRAQHFTIAHDVRGLQELIVPQTTDGAMTPIRLEHPFSELLLVQSLLHGPCDITSTDVRLDRFLRQIPEAGKLPFVDGDRKRQRLRRIAHDKDRVLSFVLSFDDPVEVDQGDAPPHCRAKAEVVTMIRFFDNAPSVAVAQQAIIADGVIVGASPIVFDRNRCDAQWNAADTRLEDAWRRLQRHPLTLEHEAVLQLAPIQQVGGTLSSFVQEGEGRESHSKVGLVHAQILPAPWLSKPEVALGERTARP